MASPTPPAGQAWPHALDPRLVKRLWQRADQPGCIRHSQARAILSRHSRMTGGPPLAGLLQRRSGVAAGAWAAQPPIVTARPTAAAPGPPPLQVMGEGTARPAARASRRRHPARPPPRPCYPGRPHPSRPRPGPPCGGWCSAPLRRTRPCHRQRARSRPKRQRPGRGRSMTGRRTLPRWSPRRPCPGRRPRPQAQRAAARLGCLDQRAAACLDHSSTPGPANPVPGPP